MIGLLREWLSRIIISTLLLSILQMLIPDGSIRKIASFTSGLVLLSLLLQPLLQLDFDALFPENFGEEIAARQEELAVLASAALETRIADKTASYICEKGTELGLSISVRVTLQEENGLPVPQTVSIDADAYSPELADWIASVLDIPHERQIWREMPSVSLQQNSLQQDSLTEQNSLSQAKD